jgi:hypothetical protein
MMAFIEVNRYQTGDVKNFAPMPAHLLKWSGEVNKKHGIETIAIFRIYPKVKPMIAHYDYDLKTTIIE